MSLALRILYIQVIWNINNFYEASKCNFKTAGNFFGHSNCPKFVQNLEFQFVLEKSLELFFYYINTKWFLIHCSWEKTEFSTDLLSSDYDLKHWSVELLSWRVREICIILGLWDFPPFILNIYVDTTISEEYYSWKQWGVGDGVCVSVCMCGWGKCTHTCL